MEQISLSPDFCQPRARILVVDGDDSVLAFVDRSLVREGYGVVGVRSARAALLHLRSNPVDLLLTDTRMPDEDGMWMLRVVRSQYPHVPVVMMTGLQDQRIAVSCLRGGASDYLSKPLDTEELRISVRRVMQRSRLEAENLRYRRDLEGMVLDRTRELRRALAQKDEAHVLLLEALVQALDARERDTHNHSLRVASYTAAMARRLGIEEPSLSDLYKGALLHDVGKIGIPDAILLKPGSLTPDEWGVMKTHPRIGARILEGIPFLEGAREIVLSHHERWDGRGYPGGLTGERIPLGARIFALADTFDVMTSGRPYRDPQPVERVEGEVVRCAGGQFDPDLADLFLRMLRDGSLLPRSVQSEAIPDGMRRARWARRPAVSRPVPPIPAPPRPSL